MFKNIIFDWSGVIKDSTQDQCTLVNEIFKKLGVREISLTEFKENWEQPYMRFYNKYVPNLTLAEEQATYQQVISFYSKGKAYPGIAETIKYFQKMGIKMVVLSSDFPETLLPEITNFGLENVFLEVITNAYDKAEGMAELIQKHNFKLDETIALGDSNHEIEEGKKVGIKTGAITWGFCTKEKLASLQPDFIINNLDELKSVILT